MQELKKQRDKLQQYQKKVRTGRCDVYTIDNLVDFDCGRYNLVQIHTLMIDKLYCLFTAG